MSDNPTSDPLILDSRYGAVTLRDLFAAAAITGSVSDRLRDGSFVDESWPEQDARIAATAYEIADAMLIEREKSR